jgi:hypothetical protein
MLKMTILALDAPLSNDAKKKKMGRLLLWLGLCIMLTTQIFCVHERTISTRAWERRHPLSSRPAIPDNKVRILSLSAGTSDPSKSKQAYPYLLSPNVHNVAVRAGDLTLIAACAQSVVKDHVYDVITIEYSGAMDEATRHLVVRLRERFPQALLVVVRLWHPSQVVYKESSQRTINLHEFKRQHDNLSLHSKDLYVQVLEAGPTRWSVDTPSMDLLLQQTLAETQSQFVSLGVPAADVFNFPQTLYQYMLAFEPESDDLSPSGHAAIARSIGSLIHSDAILNNPLRNTVGGWGSGDQCHLWTSPPESSAGVLRRFLRSSQDETGSSAVDGQLAHKRVVPLKGETIQVVNPFAEERLLYITYMTSSTSSSKVGQEGQSKGKEGLDGPSLDAANDDDRVESVFPKTQVHIDNQPMVLLDPVHEGKPGSLIARTAAVGWLSPGRHTLRVLPVSKTPQPFTWMGYGFWSSDISRASHDHAMDENEQGGESLVDQVKKSWR